MDSPSARTQLYGWTQFAIVRLMSIVFIFTIGWTGVATNAQTENETPSTPPLLSLSVGQTIYLPLIHSDSFVQASVLSPLPPERPELGLVYAGLVADTTGVCKGLWRVAGTNYCTHGPDLPPPGFNVKEERAAVPASENSTFSPSVCDGDGVSGNRVQVLYVRASDQPDRYTQYLASIRQWAAEADQIYYESAVETGGSRRIRFVHDTSCAITVGDVVVSPAGDDDFWNTVYEVQAQGYNRSDRNYMMFVDASLYCGVGSIYWDDQPGQANLNNLGPSYGRTDNGCWDGAIVAHELMHNLGGVQMSAPNTSGGWHCVDEYDLMCYSDYPDYPDMQVLCPDSAHEQRLDCNHDDYYHTNPVPGSYLATYWNAANSQFLIASSPLPRDVIFKDDFESGNLSKWSSSVTDGGDLSVSSAARLVGAYGLQANIDDNRAIYVMDDSPNNETRYRARFYFDPNSIKMASGDAHRLFFGYQGTSAWILRVEFRFSGGKYQLRAALLNDGTSWKTSNFYTISDAPHAIELDWKAATAAGANNGSLTLWIDGVQKANLTGVDNDTRRIDQVRLGPVDSIDTGTRGRYSFDHFESRRQTYIGLASSNAATTAPEVHTATAEDTNIVTEEEDSSEDVIEKMPIEEKPAASEAHNNIYLPLIATNMQERTDSTD